MAGCWEGSCFAFFRFEVTFAAVFPPTIDPFISYFFKFEVTFAAVFPPTIDPFFPTFCSKNYFCIIMVCS